MEKSVLTRAMRLHVVDRLAEDRLDAVNKLHAPVKPRDTFYTRFGKRAIDIVLSGLFLLATFPLNLILGVCTYFDVGRPIFFRQERAGKNGSVFKIVKFRNMENLVDERGELLSPEKRVTRFGTFVRRTSLDELLNFWSIFKGDMSIIGPRPLPPVYNSRYSKRHIARLSVRPGLECPPRNDLGHVRTWQEQFEDDIWYVENVSFLTDCYMLWRLVKFALNRKSSEARAISQRGTFMGYTLDGRAIGMDEVPQSYIDECDPAIG